MALQTKTIDGSTNHSSWDFKLIAIENSTSTSGNNSSLTVEAYIGRIGSSSYITGGEISVPISVTGCSKQTISGTYTTGTIAAGGWYKLGSKNFTVPHNSDGSKDITISASFTNDVSPSSGSASGSMTLTKIPRQANITGADNFNDEGNPKITYSNPAGNSVSSLQACIASSDGNTIYANYRDISKTGSSYTFNLTDAERETLRNATPNSNSLSVKFYIRTVISGTYYYSTSSKTMTIVNGNPTFTNFEYKDTNEKVTSITGNNQVLVKGLSNLEVTISSSNKMVANKGSSVNKYIATIDNTNVNSNYSANDLIINLGNISSAGTKRLNVRAYDSRNNSTLVYKDITVYDYDKPVINATVNRLNNFENQTTLQVSGTYSRLTIDDVDKNIVNTLQYRYCEVDGEWSEWQDLTATIENGTFSCNDVILSLDNTKAFKFEIRAIDNLDSNSVELPLDVGQAIFFISSNKKACYINGQEILTYDIVDEW